MTLIDANLLVYAYDSSSPRHEAAKDWIEERFSNPEPVRIAWTTVLAFVRITTNPNLLERPLSIDEAAEVVDEWLTLPQVRLAHPGPDHWPLLRRLLADGQAVAGLAMDAHLAALAIGLGAQLHSTDRDFTRFEGLRWSNPLESRD